MTTAADTVRTFIAAELTGWRVQFGRWVDGNKTDKYAVIQPVGGGMASLTRSPKFTVILIGAQNEAQTVPYEAASGIIEAMRTDNGSLVVMQAGEPVTGNTDDGRPMVEFSVSTITN